MKNRKGITLVELIVALAIVGFVFSIVFTSLIFGNRTSRTTMTKYQAQADIRLVITYITENIRNATELKVISLEEAKAEIEAINNETIEGITYYHSYMYFESGDFYFFKWEGDSFREYRVESSFNLDQEVFTKVINGDVLDDILGIDLEIRENSKLVSKSQLKLVLKNINIGDPENSIEGVSGNALKFKNPVN